MAYTIFDKELRSLQKRANQRMRRLEQADIQSPAYKGIQSKLEMMGIKKNETKGRRFSETGKGTRNEIAQQKAILKEFLEHKTSTVSGTKKLNDAIWNTANDKFNLSEHGISKEDYLNIWENLPNKTKDRMYGSEVYIDIVKTVTRIQNNLEDDQKLSIKEIVDAIEASKNEKEAYKQLGITYKDLAFTKAIDSPFED